MKLGSLFVDGAVLQREKPIVIWGTCAPRVLVTAQLAGSSAAFASAYDGRFELRLPALPAGGPYELTVRAEESGEECVVKNVLIGEVWLAGGQSNMEFPLETFECNDPLEQTPQYLEEGGNDPWLRMATIQHQSLGTTETTVPTEWQESNADNAPAFSAVGAWFALQLRKELDVPVGIIHDSWGGTYIHSWMSRNALMRLPCEAGCNELQDEIANSPKSWGKIRDSFLKEEKSLTTTNLDFEGLTVRDRGISSEAADFAKADFDDTAWKTMMVPGSWIQQGINGNGATWIRRTVELPAAWEGVLLKLHFGGIDKHDISFFNGVEVGRTGEGLEENWWFTPRCYDVPAELVHSGKNTIAIRAFSFFFDGSFNGRNKLFFLENPATGERIELIGEWRATAEYEIKFPPEVYERVKTVKPNTHEPQEWSQFNHHARHQLFDGMFRPIIPYTIRGAIWYQGCNDASFIDTARSYEEKFKAMVDEWRYLWGEGDFPFYYVQLANFNAQFEPGWLIVQEAQRRAEKVVPNCAMITSTDIGEAADIHPHNKRIFGGRLARLALHYTYGKDGYYPPQGPNFLRAEACGSELRAFFDCADGLCANDEAQLRGFEIAGYDMKFMPANARIDGQTVRLTSPEVAQPAYVRYNWRSNPDGNLANCSGLPAATFTSVPDYRQV